MKEITKQHVINWLPIRSKDTYKGEMGRILCIGGNSNMGGAVIMTGKAALYSGAGLVTVATAPENRMALHAHAPEIMFCDMYDLSRLEELIKDMDVIAIGPGLGQDNHAAEIVNTVLKHGSKDQKVVIDADAINVLAQAEEKPQTYAELIYTPHIGEWERLTGLSKTEFDQQINEQLRSQLAASVVLKGSPTEVYLAGETWINATGNPSQATGGMGDTLTGIIAGLLGQMRRPKEAILTAVFIHSYIADQLAKTHYVTLPSHIIEQLPLVMRELIQEKQHIAPSKM